MIDSIKKFYDAYLNDKTPTEDKAIDLMLGIEAEIDKYYLPRPLFNDGEPVRIGDWAKLEDSTRYGEVIEIDYKDGEYYAVYLHDGNKLFHTPWLLFTQCLDHPDKQDTQASILNDTWLDATEYCKKRGIERRPGIPSEVLMMRDLVERQRKLDKEE